MNNPAPRVPPKARTYKSKLEQRYADEILAPLLRVGRIRAWWYEPSSWALADDTRYTPDFWVICDDGTVEVHEVKGFMREAARIRLHVFARVYHFPTYLIAYDKGTWHRARVSG